MRLRLALTRPVSESIVRCQLSFRERAPIDVAVARAQHRAYEQALEDAGCTVERLPAADQLPDAVFVEDIALVLDEIAIITRPGAESRRAETDAVAERLAGLRPTATISAPATLDGGDVLRVGRRLYVGRTVRTNEAGHQALARIAEPLGYVVVPIQVRGCLHLKSAASWIGDDRILVDPARVPLESFAGLDFLTVPPAETDAANALRVGGTVLVADGFHRTQALLDRLGLDWRPVANSELAKAEGGLTCCSLIVEEPVQ
jgi:dimethylargininase